MKVAVLGGGVIGVCTAYYLAKAGHEVHVLERNAGVSLETSHANAGEVSPGYASPWAAPGIPRKALWWLLNKHSPLALRPWADWRMLPWLAEFRRYCTAESYQLNKGRMVRLAEYSRDCLRELRVETGIHYDERSLGTLQLFRTQKQLDHSAKDAEVLTEQGVPFTLLDRAGVIDHEPGLEQVQGKFTGGLHLPGDETGDCFKFTSALADKAETLGVTFHYGTEVKQLVVIDNSWEGVITNNGIVHADACVVAMGSYSARLLKPLNIHLPVYPVKGYSLTVPITHPELAPESTVMDESHKIAITRLGDRIRLGGTAELSGFDLKIPPKRIATLKHVLKDLFPEGGDMEQAAGWAGLRPMTPDGPPILGKTSCMNLFLNTGHGTLGWTMAAGSGRVLADMISGLHPPIAIDGLGLERYG